MNFEDELLARDDAARKKVLESGYDGVDIVVMSLHEVGRYQPGPDEVCISISTDKWGKLPAEAYGKFAETLFLDFDDTGFADAADPFAKPLSDEQAKSVIEFAERNLGRRKIIVHCFAGMSRSRSMAQALCECFRLPFRYTVLNKSVWRGVHRAFRERDALGVKKA